MSVYIHFDGRLRNSREQHMAVRCPQCQVLSHITPVSIPDYKRLTEYKPKDVGMVYRCDSCNAPVFLKYAVKNYHEDHVELSTHFIELERAREKFNFTYLPEGIESLFREALRCYTHNCFTAFAMMCQRTVAETFHDLGNASKLRLFDQFNEARELAEIDDITFAVVKSVVFDTDNPARKINPNEAAVLLELVKDLLYQAYVRKGKLQQAVMMRQYFLADEDPRDDEDTVRHPNLSA